jgi:hypothetical protein
MPVYDLECQIDFGRPVEASERAAFNSAAGVSHPGWHGPQTVVNWKGDREAVVFLVLKGPGPDQGSGEDSVRQEAETRIRGWAKEAGLAGDSPDGVKVTIEAIPRP